MVIQKYKSSAQDSNYFYRANFGIVAKSSYSTFRNNKFERIYKDTLYLPWYSGTAIVGYGDYPTFRDSRITVLPLNSHAPTVQNSQRGIFTHFSKLTVDSTDFNKVKVGIFAEKCVRGLNTRVTNCKINATNGGIRWRLNDGASSMYAVNNTITMDGDTTGTGISLYESGGLANYYIASNTIYLNSAKRGIHAQAAYKPIIIFNPNYAIEGTELIALVGLIPPPTGG